MGASGVNKYNSACVDRMQELFSHDERTGGGTQPCAALPPNWVEEYALDMMAGAEFPPVVVFGAPA
jgi:hypothetical protein